MDSKNITIQGQHNRYKMKKLTKSENKIKPNKLSFHHLLHDMHYDVSFQIQFIETMYTCIVTDDPVYRLLYQQLQHKLNGYKHQDTKKGGTISENVIDLSGIIEELHKCKLVCYYCTQSVLLLYKNQRDPKQWTLDRIDNDIGHVKNNVRIVCLQCNLKRKRQNDKNFLFTSQLKINKLN